MQKLEKKYRARNAWGMVASIDVYDCEPRFISDFRKIEKLIISLCKEIKMKRHGKPLIERFGTGSLEGCSAMQFIETSSITLHFDETENRAFIDIFSCKYFDYKKAEKYCRDFLQSKKSKAFYFFRH